VAVANGGFLLRLPLSPGRQHDNFGFGDNQIGAEFLGPLAQTLHGYSVSLLTTDDGRRDCPAARA